MGFKKFKRLQKGSSFRGSLGTCFVPKKDDNLSHSAPPSLVSRPDLRLKIRELWQRWRQGPSRTDNYLSTRFTSRIHSKMRAASGGSLLRNN